MTRPGPPLCASCPCPPGLACLGTSTHPMFCDWSLRGEHRAAVVNRSRIAADGPPPAAAAAPPPARDNGLRDALRAVRAARARAEACPHRTPTGSCGCEGYCGRGRGRPALFADGSPATVVTLDDCGRCDDPAAPPPWK